MELPKQSHLYCYDENHHKRKLPSTCPFYFFGTSSRGNATYIKPLHTLIDFGLPYKHYTELNDMFFFDVEYICLTHTHGDHLNLPAVKKILRSFPHIQFIASPTVNAYLKEQLDELYIPERFIELTWTDRGYYILNLSTRDNLQFKIAPYLTHHEDIINTAYVFYWNASEVIYSDADNYASVNDEHQLLYASDFNDIKDLPIFNNFKLDYCLLEANYDIEIINQRLLDDPDDFEAQGNLRHLSEQDAWRYVQANVHGYFLPLHASEHNGTLIQDLEGESKNDDKH